MSSQLTIDGLDECMELCESLGQVGTKIEKESLRSAMKPGLQILKDRAPKRSGTGANALRIDKIKKYKSGSLWGSMGIDSTNWEQTKSIYFQHYGYHNNGLKGRYHGMYIDKHAGWYDRAFKEMEGPILDKLEQEVTRKIDKILR